MNNKPQTDHMKSHAAAAQLCRKIVAGWPRYGRTQRQSHDALLAARGLSRFGRRIEPEVVRQTLGDKTVIYVVRSPEPVRYA